MFKKIIKGMPNGAEAIQENFETLEKGIGNISDDGVLKTKGVDTGSFFLGGREFMTEPKSLVPYLGADFKELSSLFYVISGNLVTITGTIAPKKDLGDSKGGRFTMFENLPFKVLPEQVVLQQGPGTRVFNVLPTGNTIYADKHREGTAYVAMTKEWGLKITSTFIIE